MDEDKLTYKQQAQELVINAAVKRYETQADPFVKKQLCYKCLCKSRGCFKCKAAKIYEKRLILDALVEAGKWN